MGHLKILGVPPVGGEEVQGVGAVEEVEEDDGGEEEEASGLGAAFSVLGGLGWHFGGRGETQVTDDEAVRGLGHPKRFRVWVCRS